MKTRITEQTLWHTIRRLARHASTTRKQSATKHCLIDWPRWTVAFVSKHIRRKFYSHRSLRIIWMHSIIPNAERFPRFSSYETAAAWQIIFYLSGLHHEATKLRTHVQDIYVHGSYYNRYTYERADQSFFQVFHFIIQYRRSSTRNTG
jgi:hypothetical protein